jgi:hypothetical protein
MISALSMPCRYIDVMPRLVWPSWTGVSGVKSAEETLARAGRSAPSASGNVVPFGQAVRTWGAIGLQTFGGPAGQIAVMQRILVDEMRWIGLRRFLHALNYCMLLPGP